MQDIIFNYPKFKLNIEYVLSILKQMHVDVSSVEPRAKGELLSLVRPSSVRNLFFLFMNHSSKFKTFQRNVPQNALYHICTNSFAPPSLRAIR